MVNALQFAFEKLNAKKKAHRQGTASKSSRRFIPADDPVKIEARRRKRERDAREVPAATALGLDKAQFKKLNREYKALRVAGKITLSYSDWMRERLSPGR